MLFILVLVKPKRFFTSNGKMLVEKNILRWECRVKKMSNHLYVHAVEKLLEEVSRVIGMILVVNIV